MAIEGITGLKINYWAMVNLEGFKDLVDAVGGVTLNVRQPIPVGGLGSDVTGYIEPGTPQARRPRHAVVRPRPRGLRRLLADGAAEVRDERDAHADQPADGAAQLREDRAGQLGDDLHQHPARRGRPRSSQLALKARSQKVATLSLVPPMINTADPDIDAGPARRSPTAIDRAEGERRPRRRGKKKRAPRPRRPAARCGTPRRRVRRQRRPTTSAAAC